MVARGRAQPHYVRRRIVAAVVVLGGVAVIVLAVGSVAEHVAYAGRVLPGVSVDGARVATKRRTQAYDVIARIGADLDRTPVRVRAGSARFVLMPSAIGYDVDANATAARAERA